MSQFVLFAVLSVVFIGGHALLGRIRARRSRAAELGATARIPCLLRGSGESSPPRFRRGWLILGNAQVCWRPREQRGAEVMLTDLTSVGYRRLTRRGRDPRSDRVIFTCVRGAGDVVELSCTEQERDGVAAALRRASGATTAGIGYQEASAAVRDGVRVRRGFVRWMLSPSRGEAANWRLGRSWWREPILRIPFLIAVFTAASVAVPLVVLAVAAQWPSAGVAAVTAVVVGLLLAFWVASTARTAYTRWSSAHEQPGRELRYLLCFTPGRRPVLILYPPDGDNAPPVGLLPVAARAVQAYEPPAAGSLTLHGRPGEGSVVVPHVDGLPLWPTGPLRPAPPDTVQWLVNGAPDTFEQY